MLDHLVLAKKWCIPPEKALNMIWHTTQHGVYTVLHPSLSLQFRTNNHHLRYRGLQHNLYSDTLFVSIVSRKGNKCAQIFATDFGWSCLFQMKLKSKALEALSLLFQQDGVMPAAIYNNAKETIQGEFNRKIKVASCHLWHTESFTHD